MYSIILVLFAFVFTINSTDLINSSVVFTHENRTLQVCKSDPDIISIMKIVDPFTKYFIPFLIMMSLNVKVVLELRKSKKLELLRRGSIRNNLTAFTNSTILIDFIYLTIKTPEIVYQIVALVNNNNMVNFNVMLRIFSHISFLYSAAILIIFLVFNKIFRGELVVFLRLNKLSNFYLKKFSNREIVKK